MNGDRDAAKGHVQYSSQPFIDWYPICVRLPDVAGARADIDDPIAAGDHVHIVVDDNNRVAAWTVGLAGGLLEGAPLRLAAEMARVARTSGNEDRCDYLLAVSDRVRRRFTKNVLRDNTILAIPILAISRPALPPSCSRAKCGCDNGAYRVQGDRN
jgi:hypothetical protein